MHRQTLLGYSPLLLRPLLLVLAAHLAISPSGLGQLQPIHGTKCSANQVVSKLTVYEDGAIEAECNKLPCGITGANCILNQTACRAETDTFSGMRWAINGQSVLLRCCALSVPQKIYIGTDLVSLGSYYSGGPVEQKDLYSKNGNEFDYVSNIRTEQGGVRVWVFRVICVKNAQPSSQMQPQTAPIAVMNGQNNVENTNPLLRREPQNPLKYTPANYHQRDSPLIDSIAGDPSERLI